MFLDEDRFPFLEGLRRAWPDIRDECQALAEDTFEPWVQREMYGEGWSVYGLVAFGNRIDAALEELDEVPPEVAAALQRGIR